MTLQKKEANNKLARPEHSVMQGLTSEDFAPPEFKLVAPVSALAAEGLAKPGQWYSGELGIAKDKLNAALVLSRKGRILWTEGELGAPRCSSDDAVNPRPGSEFEGLIGQGGCEVCPMKDDGCDISYMMLFQDLDDDFTFQVRVSSWSGRMAVRNYNTAIQVSTKGEAYRRSTTIQSVKKTSASRSIVYYAPQFLLGGEDLDAEVVEYLGSVAGTLAGVAVGQAPREEAPKEEKAPERAPRARRARNEAPVAAAPAKSEPEEAEDGLY